MPAAPKVSGSDCFSRFPSAVATVPAATSWLGWKAPCGRTWYSRMLTTCKQPHVRFIM